MRVAILLKKAEADGTHLDKDRIFLAKHVQSNVRQGRSPQTPARLCRFSGQDISVDVCRGSA
jgi:chromosomal replication initiation ATPase DnaA